VRCSARSHPDFIHPSQARSLLLTCSGPLPTDTAAVTCTNFPTSRHLELLPSFPSLLLPLCSTPNRPRYLPKRDAVLVRCARHFTVIPTSWPAGCRASLSVADEIGLAARAAIWRCPAVSNRIPHPFLPGAIIGIDAHPGVRPVLVSLFAGQ
jgi:hypothetical protein